MRLLIARPLRKKYSLRWAATHEQSLADGQGGDGGKPPCLGTSAQAHTHVALFFKHQLSGRTHPPECACSVARERSSSLFCACATVIPQSPHPPPGSVARAASFERAGKAVGEGGASGYSLHGCAKERRRRPRLKREGRSGERRRGERGDWPGAQRGRGYRAMAGGTRAEAAWRYCSL